MKIVEYSKGSITEVENVFKVVESGAQGPPGTIGTLDQLDNKPVVVAADLALTGDSASSFANKNSTWQQIIDSVIRTALDLIYSAILNIKNWGTIAGATTLNATSYSTQTADFTASFTATLEGFTGSRQSIAFEFVVASGDPTVTLAGSIFKFYTTLNLSALAAGSYVAYFKSSDSGTNTKVFVKLAP